MSAAIRLALTVVMLVMVHGETGTWTALSLALIAVTLELSAWEHRRARTALLALSEALVSLINAMRALRELGDK